MSVRFHLPNGWTLSVAPEVPPAKCNVAAWPSSMDAVPGAPYFVFKDTGYIDKRCYSIDEMLAAIEEVRAAPGPV